MGLPQDVANRYGQVDEFFDLGRQVIELGLGNGAAGDSIGALVEIVFRDQITYRIVNHLNSPEDIIGVAIIHYPHHIRVVRSKRLH